MPKVRRERFWHLAAVLVALQATGCGGGSTEPESVALATFDRLWETFDQRYSFFVVKDVDWDAIRTQYRPRVSGEVGEDELWDVVTEMLALLEDGHVSLQSSRHGRWSYTGWYDRYPPNFDLDIVRERYLDGDLQAVADGHVQVGRLSEDVGYVHIPNFGGRDWAFLNEVGGQLGEVSALVIDIRDNPGGNDQNGREIAARFADQRRLFRVIRWRNGPEHDDFDPPIEDFIEPAGAHFPGPVALLTNRRVFSSAEGFVLMMRVLPQVVVVGDTTGGGSANPEEFTLPNGWRARVSRWWVQTPEGDSFEGVGLGPDIPVQITPEDGAAGRDAILERALTLLEETLGSGS